ncbi:MAG: cytochrome c family protein [Acidobacteriota bacterium]|nr:cytochrome c family protein [Acidobacteriota bacterium]
MPQIFHYSTNTLSKISIVATVLILAATGGALFELLADSSYATRQGQARPQPVPFSHTHHVGSMGIDCRYCHNTVEISGFANIPPTKTCMNCHSQIWVNSPTLEPVRASYRSDQSIPWTRVHDLPDFVYFNHGIHVNKGVGCETCHGRVDQMPLMLQKNSLEMRWCLDCHRNPEQYVRPREAVFKMGYVPPEDQLVMGRRLVKENHIQKLDTCYTCHR